jgi:hypothetical protein
MMASAIKTPPPPDLRLIAGSTFTTSARDEIAARRRTSRLASDDVEDLRYALSGVSSDLRLQSVHAAVERRLMMAPPRFPGAPVLEELMRLGGRASEGRVVRIVRMEGWGTRSEIDRAVRRLVSEERIEKIAVPLPVAPAPADRTPGEQLRLEDWTGFDLKLVAHRRHVLALKPEERWQRDDEELEREWRIVHGTETRSTAYSYEPSETVQWGRIVRVRAALAKIPDAHCRIIAVVFRERLTESEELEAVRELVGGDEDHARVAIDNACRAYREARKS